MRYSIPIIERGGKRYFSASYNNMRFLFRRMNASSLILAPEGDDMDKFEVRRDDEVVMAGSCYNMHREHPVFLIHYSELAGYDPKRNDADPHQTLFADDFLPGDRIFSDVNACETKARGFAMIMSFMGVLDAKMQSAQEGMRQQNLTMIAAANQSFIRRMDTNEDVLGLKTFIVPVDF